MLVVLVLILLSGCSGENSTVISGTFSTSPASSTSPVVTNTPVSPVTQTPALPSLTPTLALSATPTPVASITAGSRVAAGTELVFALLGDNRLLGWRTVDGSKVFEQNLPPSPAANATRIPGRYLALSKDGKTLLALVPGSGSNLPDRITVFDLTSSQLKASYSLTADKADPSRTGPAAASALSILYDGYHSLAIGPKTGRLYLFGNRKGEVIVTVLDPNTGSELANWVARKRDLHNWLVYQGAVSEGEQQLYISYHGDDTSGIDRFTIKADGSLEGCAQLRPDWGCLGAHGGFVIYGNKLLVTYGYPVIVTEALDGSIPSGYNTGLTNSHVTEFVVDQKTEKLYAINTCLAPDAGRGGFSTVDLKSGAMPNLAKTPGGQEWGDKLVPPQVLITPGASETVLCGERLALGANGLVAVAKVTVPPYLVQTNSGGAVLLVNGANGQITQTIPTNSVPLDVLVASMPS